MTTLVYHNPDCATSRNTLAMIKASGEALEIINYLKDPTLSDEQLIAAMLAHPILFNRPIGVPDRGVRLCRPTEQVLSLLGPSVTRFPNEDGEVITYPETV